jgi:catechol 2,3-dioxygenase-like lactoylglutathione lyase family enzyme
MIIKLSHASLFVTDQAKAQEFYVNKLGFEIRTEAPMAENMIWLTVGPKDQPDVELVIIPVQKGWGRMFEREEIYQAFRMLVENNALGGGVMSTPDCHATYEELVGKGVIFKSPPKQQFYGIEAIMIDGVGNWFSLTQRTI